jgi:hypothetical protein
MKRFALFAALAAAVLVTTFDAPAKAEGPVGIAFAQAEEGTWWCRGGDAGKALSCALDKCKEGANGQECHATRWCGLAGWSALMIIWLPEHHSTTIVCGTPGEAAAIASLKALCDNDEVVTRCQPIGTIDPDGKEQRIEDLEWPGPTSLPPQETDAVPEPPPAASE